MMMSQHFFMMKFFTGDDGLRLVGTSIFYRDNLRRKRGGGGGLGDEMR